MSKDLYSLIIEYRNRPETLDNLVEKFVEIWSPRKDGPMGKCGSCRYVEKDGASLKCTRHKSMFYHIPVNHYFGCICWKANIF